MARGGRRRQVEEDASQGAGRVSFSTKAARTEDETGKIRVYITALDGESGKPIPNNITRTLYVSDATVTEVAEAVAGAFAE
jgi:hypothetical protein